MRGATEPLTRQRLVVRLRCQQVATALAAQRREPPWQWRPIVKQVTDLFGPIESADQWQLDAALWLLDEWLALLPVAADAFWSDPDNPDDTDD